MSFSGAKGRYSDDIVLKRKLWYASRMGKKVVGGISEHQDLQRFAALSGELPVKDQIDLMGRCWFSHTTKRTEPIEYSFVDPRTKQVESVRISGTPEYGIATIHDQDLLLFVISQWVEAKKIGLPATRRIQFTPYQFFTWINREPTGSAYQRLRDALVRLKTTNIETTLDYESGSRRHRKKLFSWISEWELTEEDGRIRGIEVVLAEWLFDSIQDFHVLTLDREYFAIPGSVERWLYLYARKATGGGNGVWKESFKSLYQKSASQQAFKHYASRLRDLVKQNELPGLRLEQTVSKKGEPVLKMQRAENQREKPTFPERQLVLVEVSPLEEAWQNVLESFRVQLGEASANAWIGKLRFVSLEGGALTYHSPSNFIADYVRNTFGPRLIAAWKNVGHEVKELRFAVAKESAA
ncbi:MAG: replication initiator protein A [Chthoniobacteraceae bacterium]